MLVRDPVVVTASLPRFLAPGDKSRLLLDLASSPMPPATVELSVHSTGDGDRRRSGLRGPRRRARRQASERLCSIPIAGDTRRRLTSITVVADARRRDATGQVACPRRPPERAAGRDQRLRHARAGRRAHRRLEPARRPRARHRLGAGLARRRGPPRTCRRSCARSTAIPMAAPSRSPAAPCRSSISTTWRSALGIGGDPDVHERVAEGDRRRARQPGGRRLVRPLGRRGAERPVARRLCHRLPDRAPRRRAIAVPAMALRPRARQPAEPHRLCERLREGRRGHRLCALRARPRTAAPRSATSATTPRRKLDAFATPLAKAQIGAALALYGDKPRADAVFRAALGALSGRERRRRLAGRLRHAISATARRC